jgi:hypothetical protein
MKLFICSKLCLSSLSPSRHHQHPLSTPIRKRPLYHFFLLKEEDEKKSCFYLFFFSSVSSSQSPTLPNATEQLWKSLPTEVCSSDGRFKEIRRAREKHFPHPTPLFWGLFVSNPPLSPILCEKKSF